MGRDTCSGQPVDRLLDDDPITKVDVVLRHGHTATGDTQAGTAGDVGRKDVTSSDVQQVHR